jgi:hypothetical protein
MENGTDRNPSIFSRDGPKDSIDVDSPFGDVSEDLFTGFFGEGSDDGLVAIGKVMFTFGLSVVAFDAVAGSVGGIVDIEESFTEFCASA